MYQRYIFHLYIRNDILFSIYLLKMASFWWIQMDCGCLNTYVYYLHIKYLVISLLYLQIYFKLDSSCQTWSIMTELNLSALLIKCNTRTQSFPEVFRHCISILSFSPKRRSGKFQLASRFFKKLAHQSIISKIRRRAQRCNYAR